jgi:hypothetical protein
LHNLGRALSAAGKCGYYAWLFAEEFVSFPFRLFGLGGYSPVAQAERAENAALQHKEQVDAENATLERDLSAKPAQAPRVPKTTIAVLDTLEIKAALVHRFADAIVYGQIIPDLAGLDIRTRLWCEVMRMDYDAAKAVANVSPAELMRHIAGIRTISTFHAWPDDALVAEVAASYSEPMKQFDDEPEVEETRKFG